MTAKRTPPETARQRMAPAMEETPHLSEATPMHAARSKLATGRVDTNWHVAFITALATFVATAALKSSGVIFVEVMAEFRTNREMSAWPTSVQAAAVHFSGIVVRLLQMRISLTQIVFIGGVLTWAGLVASAFTTSIVGVSLTFGAIHGSGTGIIIVTLATLVVSYFDKYRGIASGIRFVGETCSSIAFPYLLLYLQDNYGFRGMMLILGAIAMHTTAFTIALKEPQRTERHQNSEKAVKSLPPDNGATSQGSYSKMSTKASADVSPKNAATSTGLSTTLLNPMFYVIAISSTVVHYSYVVFTSTVVDYGQDKGAPVARATSIIVYSSTTDLVGRLALPLLADRKYMRRSSLVMCCHLLLGLSMMMLPYVSSFGLLLINSLCVIMFSACIVTMKTVLMADYLGLDQISASYGATGILLLPLILTAPQVVGYFRDIRGMYDNFYRLLGGLNLFSGLLLFLVVCYEICAKSTAPIANG